MSAVAIAQILFGERLRTSDDLRFALAESLAHLEYLRSQGRVAMHQEDGHILYITIPATD
jgi:hypothetical protein